ncbi:hypothetical protein BGZ54_003478 [Gamsiella multidivaricata]|nr:hypothetical protein BGZ54_003478 [Gamsiella multidivaricata]
MINRNKDLRSASRRSSFNLRGKRASSIGNGFVAVPHPSVDPKYFFRHIAAEEPPPVRMRQLMAWCARKSIDSQKSSSQTALQVAKQIEEEALAMLTAGKFSVSWYTRPTDTEPIRAVPKKPHKRNMENLSKSRQYQAQIDKLRKEDEGWTRIISSFNTFHASVLDSGAALPPGDEAIILPEISADELNVELLSADDRSMWDKYCKHKDAAGTPGPATKARRDTIEGTEQSIKSNKWMQDMLGSLEKEVDNLQDTLYAASRFDKIAKQYTDQVLEQIAVALDERQRPPIMMGSSNLLNPWSSSPPTSSSIGKGETSSLRSTLASGAVSTSTSAEFILSPSIGPDSADDPWQILRALSRLSL